MRNIKGIVIGVGTLLASATISLAQIPQGYYANAAGKGGEELRTALSGIISGHTVISYDDVWYWFNRTDKNASGKIIDIYSNTPGTQPSYIYTYSTDQCGQYSQEGDCYNREHSVPQNWFGGSGPMYTDLFHVYPTDGFVNGKRSNHPYGEVGTTDWTSTNGSKLGDCNYPGYSGTVFEPIDEYKGDLARTYFYVITRYKNNISSWNSPMFSGDTLSSWALDMLIEWHDADTVDQKERMRNDAIYVVQKNRNPFIDHPEYVDFLWKGVTPPPPPPMGIEELKESVTLNFYENTLSVKMLNGQANEQLVVYNLQGQEIMSETIYNSNVSINLSNFGSGLYVAKIGATSKKIIIQ